MLGVAGMWSCIATFKVGRKRRRHCGMTTHVVVVLAIFRKHRTLGISNIRLITCRQLMSMSYATQVNLVRLVRCTYGSGQFLPLEPGQCCDHQLSHDYLMGSNRHENHIVYRRKTTPPIFVGYSIRSLLLVNIITSRTHGGSPNLTQRAVGCSRSYVHYKQRTVLEQPC